MLKVVLIDDEEIIIEGLKVLIDWNSLGLEIVGEAYDGEEGLAVIKKLRPDIVITDIRMPVVSGLEMIGLIKDFQPLVGIIILSGYSDFDYAREAIEKGADCYLLKPVTRVELIEKLNQIKNKIHAAKEKEEMDRQAAINLYNMRNPAKEKYLKDIVQGKIKIKSEMLRIWNMFELGPVPDKLCVVVFEIDDFSIEGFKNSQDRGILKFAIDNIIEELIIKINIGVFSSYDEERSMLIGYHKGGQCLKEEIIDSVKEIKDTVFELLGVTLSVGIGAVHHGLEELTYSFNEAVYVLGKKFVYGKNLTLHIDDIQTKYGDVEYKPIPLIRELAAKIESCDSGGTETLLNRLFHYMLRELNFSSGQVYAECVNLLVLLRQGISENVVKNSKLCNEEIFNINYLERFKTYPELHRWMKELIDDLIYKLANQPTGATEQLVEKIKKYVEKNYKDATRQTVANHFYVNPSYLSQIFKQTTGHGFTDYVSNIRVEKAKKVLVNSNMKIRDLAEELGYASSQYFNKVFEKYTGHTPIDYRKKIIKNPNQTSVKQ